MLLDRLGLPGDDPSSESSTGRLPAAPASSPDDTSRDANRKAEEARDMDINASTLVVGTAPRISQAKFASILRQSGSPAADEAEAGWAAVAGEGVDPAFALGIFHQESQFGTDGVCRDFATLSPGNTRTTRTGLGHVVDTPFGPFIRYPSWEEGWRDLARRLVDPEFVYAKELRRTIRPILERWAPPDDPHAGGFNNTDTYVAHVVQNMRTWADQEGEVCPLFPPPDFDGTDKQVGPVLFHAAGQTIQVAQNVTPHQFADPTTCQTQDPLQTGDTFEALYWVEGTPVAGEKRWWVAANGSRIWSGGTVQRPGASA
jgi:hypothetical protein